MRGLNMGVNTYNALIQSATLCHPSRGSHIFLHISRGFRLRQAYAVTSRRWRGSTPGLFYGAPHRGSKIRLANARGVSPTTTNLRGPRSF